LTEGGDFEFMDSTLIVIIVALAAIAVGVGLGYILTRRQSQADRRLLLEIEQSAADTRASADAEKKAVLLEAKEDAIRILATAEEQVREMRVEVQAQERRNRQKEENLDRKVEEIEQRQRRLQSREEESELRLREVERLKQEQVLAIEHVAALTREEARTLLLQRVEEEVRTEAARRARVFVDRRETAFDGVGDILQPIANGAIKESDVLGDMYDLAPGKVAGRLVPTDITYFKNAGGGHLDLMTAEVVYRQVVAGS